MKKVVFSAILACGILSISFLTVNAANDEWADLESSLYTNVPAAMSLDANMDDPVLMGSSLDFSKVAQLYNTQLDVNHKDDFNDFIEQTTRKNTIIDLFSATDMYFSTASGPKDPTPGTAIFTMGSDIQVMQVFEADRGNLYQPQFSDSLKKELENSKLDLTKSQLRLVNITGLLTGIHISDGTQEYIWSTSSIYNIVPAKKLLSLNELADIMKNNEDSIIYEESEPSIIDGKANPTLR